MEYVIVVDRDDHILGIEEKLLAHQQGSLHRAISVCLFDEQGRWLLQRRASSKYHSPGQWANSCCSHPRLLEKPLDAAKRRTFEELGIEVSLRFLKTFLYREKVGQGLIEHEFDFLFIGHVSSMLQCRPNPEEVSEVRFFTPEEIQTLFRERLQFFAPWFPHVVAEVGLLKDEILT